MTTKFLDNKICAFKTILSWRFPRKTAFLDDFPLCPQSPPFSKTADFIFIVVSPSLKHVRDRLSEFGREEERTLTIREDWHGNGWRSSLLVVHVLGTCPKDPAVLKILRDSELLHRSVFTTPPMFTMLRTLP